MDYTERNKTDEELKQLALDIQAGKVFTSGHVRPGDGRILPSIFMILALTDPDDEENGGKELADALKSGKIKMIYEYLDQAGPRSINGYPMFMSMRVLGEKDAEFVREKLKKIEEALANV